MDNSIPTVGAVIFDWEGNVVLVEHTTTAHHQTGSFGLPAGKIEPGESALQAAVREVIEETGLEIPPKSFQKLPTTYYADIEQKTGMKHFSWEVFVTHIPNGKLRASKETLPRWIPVRSLGGMRLITNVLKAVQEAEQLVFQ